MDSKIRNIEKCIVKLSENSYLNFFPILSSQIPNL